MATRLNSSNANSSGNRSGGFDASRVPYPTRYEITKPYGGMYYFALSYQLFIHDDEEYEEVKRIVDALREAEYEERVEIARGAYERGQRMS